MRETLWWIYIHSPTSSNATAPPSSCLASYNNLLFPFYFFSTLQPSEPLEEDRKTCTWSRQSLARSLSGTLFTAGTGSHLRPLHAPLLLVISAHPSQLILMPHPVSRSPLPLLLLPPSRAPLGCLIPELASWRWDVVVRGSCVTQSSVASYSSCCSKHPSLPGVKSKREHGCLSFTLSLASKGLKYSLCWTDTHITERLSRVYSSGYWGREKMN